MLTKSVDVWHIVFYDEVSLINKLKYLNVELYNLKRIGDYKYCFETLRKNRKKIKENFNDCKIVSKRGLINYLEAMLTKTTLFCVIIASMVMYNVSKRIWKIEIIGDYESVESAINAQLIRNNLIIGDFYPSSDKLREIESAISLYLTKEIEFLEIRRYGSVMNVRYQKRREAGELPIKGSNLYATKDGMIRYFDIQSGVKKVKEYDYVKKGELLVSDAVENNSGDLINIGTLGSVYANTFYVIEVNVNYSVQDEASVFSMMLDKAKKKIGNYLSKNEKIEIEKVLDYRIDNNEGYMKVYYMLLEDITI